MNANEARKLQEKVLKERLDNTDVKHITKQIKEVILSGGTYIELDGDKISDDEMLKLESMGYKVERKNIPNGNVYKNFWEIYWNN